MTFARRDEAALAGGSTELALLVAASCGRADTQTVNQLLTAGVDWTRLIALSLHHRIIGFLQRALEAGSPGLVPTEIRQALSLHVDASRTQEQEIVSELWSLLEAFSAASIAVVPFKGPLLRWQLHGRFHVGQPGDLDLLFRRRDVESARLLLEARGYEDLGHRPGRDALTREQRRLYERFQCEYSYSQPGGVVVEPHWQLCQRPLAIDLDYEGMLGRALTREVEGRAVRLLTRHDLALALCVHGAKHRWAKLAWLADFVALLRTLSRQDLAAISAAAHSQGCGLMWRVSVRLAAVCGALELPEAETAGRRDDPRLVALAALVIDGLDHPEWEEPRNDRVDPFRYRLRERRRDRLRYVLRTLITPRRYHLESVRLPAGLAWGYIALKIGTDLALRLRGSLKSVESRMKSRSQRTIG